MKKERTTPVVGQFMYIVTTGNLVRHGVEPVVTQVTVTKVARKFFHVVTVSKYAQEIVFQIEDWKQKTNFCVDYIIYETRQEWDDVVEHRRIMKVLRDIVEPNYLSVKKVLSIETLRKIEQLIELDEA